MGGGGQPVELTRQLKPTEDIDGDGLSNQKELDLGANPLVADIPKLDLSISQNIDFKIEMNHLGEEKNLSFSYKIDPNSPYYQPFVGKPIIRERLREEAASIARFPNHRIGTILDRDLSFYTYPKFSDDWRFKKALEMEEYSESTIHNVFLNFDLAINLEASGVENSIRDLELNFYVYNEAQTDYQLISTESISRVFQKGIIESVPMSLRVSKEFLFEEVLKKGSFLYIEVKDFYIQDRSKSLNQIKASVKEKTIPVVLNIQDSTKTYFVANQDNLDLFKVMNTLFKENFEIREDKLFKIKSYESNLTIPENLSDLRGEENLGSWFIQSNIENENLFKKTFNKGDFLILTYFTGSEISRAIDRTYRSKALNKTSGSSLIDLGKLTASSKVLLGLELLEHFGEKNHESSDIVSGQRNCGSNCSGKDVRCFFDINRIENFSKSIDLTIPLESIYLIYKNNRVSLESIKDKVFQKIEGNTLFIDFDRPWTLFSELENGSHNSNESLFLEFAPKTTNINEGVVLSHMEGAHLYYCPMLSTMYSENVGLPLNEASSRFNEWQMQVNWGNIARGTSKLIREDHLFNVISEIENYYN